ncbi:MULTISPECIES: hypothetical protein [unclassified Moorena]|uniref:hypothetical protein n=1 Tax=unclassified Moorena TaxID=2683338 RepID=UPI0013CC0981|nr:MULTISPECIES: hypothetical protein [unclassified Moorena]NEO18746.1 hypothetical protein [Moorena sp. SIO4A5]NEQ61743.1 hypothetical protein [Moorena sp. SIO4A1]
MPTPPNGNGYKAFGHAGRVRPKATLRERQALLTTRSEVTARIGFEVTVRQGRLYGRQAMGKRVKAIVIRRPCLRRASLAFMVSRLWVKG